MNLYFLLEGEKTEVLLYPKWIQYILPNYKQVDFFQDAIKDNFYIFSGGGIPSIYNHTINAIKDINASDTYNKLIVCLDAEELTVQERITEIKGFIEKENVTLNSNCTIDFVIQNVCIETWFLGNKRIVKKIPEGLLLKEFINHFDVRIDDPEQMKKIEGHRNKAAFHYSYFREILKEKNLHYSKSRPNIVLEKTFFDQLEKRVNETNHLKSFKQLLTLLYEIKK